MAALIAAIHVLKPVKGVDPRNKSGDDVGEKQALVMHAAAICNEIKFI
jgi:hypothetical protein